MTTARRGWHPHPVVAPGLVGGLLVIGLVAVLPFDGPGASGRLTTPAQHRETTSAPASRLRPGEPCRMTRHYPVKFVMDLTGHLTAVFMIAGGTSSGSVSLSAQDAQLAVTHDAYVSDVQLGSYEPSTPSDPNSEFVCRLNPTFHFYCPATNQLDQLCLTWVPRQAGVAPPEQAARD